MTCANVQTTRRRGETINAYQTGYNASGSRSRAACIAGESAIIVTGSIDGIYRVCTVQAEIGAEPVDHSRLLALLGHLARRRGQ
jgi:hypothetical protein